MNTFENTFENNTFENTFENKRKKIIEIIKRDEITELEIYITKNNIQLNEFNNENFDLLIYSLKHYASFQIINFIINQCQYTTLNYTFQEYGTPLFLAVARQEFKIADLLIKYNADINFKISSFNRKNVGIIYYLYRINCLYNENLKYILDKDFNIESITDNLINDLVSNHKNDNLEIIFKHYIFDNAFILSLLNIYKNKTSLSRKQLQDITINEKNKIQINEYMYFNAIKKRNYDAIRILLYNDGSGDKILEKINKYDILERAVECDNFDLVKKILNSKPLNYKYINFEKVLLDACKNINVDIIEILIKTLLSYENFDFENIHFEKILLEAIEGKNNKIMKLLVELLYHKSFDFKSINFEKILFSANKISNLNGIKLLIETLLLNQQSFDLKSINLIKFLLEVNRYNNCNHDRENIIKLLIKALLYHSAEKIDDASFDVSYIKNCNCPCLNLILNKVIEMDNFICVKRLMETQEFTMNVNIKDINGKLPIIVAYYATTFYFTESNANALEIFEYLLDHGANCNVKGNNYSLLSSAIHFKHYMVTRCLFKYNVHIDEDFSKSYHPLLKAIYQNKIKTIKLLVENRNKNKNDRNSIIPIKTNKYGFTPLILSYLLNHRKIFKYLMKYEDVNEFDSNGYTILHYAILKEDIESIKYLISIGADINYKENIWKSYNSALDISIYIRNKEIFFILLNSKNIILNLPNGKGETPLVTIIKIKNYPIEYKKFIIENLVERGSNINYIDDRKNSPLVYAIQEKSLPVVKQLVENGADVNYIIKNENYWESESILMYAIKQGETDITKYLVECRASLNFKNKCEISDLIESISRNKKTNIFEYLAQYEKNIFASNIVREIILKKKLDLLIILVAHGLDINFEDKNGNTPLIYAIQARECQIVDYLFKCGASIYGVNHKMEIIRDIINDGRLDLLKILVTHHLDILQEDNNKQTFLSYAFSSSQPTIVSYLIHCGADIQSLVNDINTIIMVIYNRSLELLKILVNHHLNVNIKDEKGNTPLVYAIKALDEQIVDYLIECGANIHNVNNEGESIYDISYQYSNFYWGRNIYTKIKKLLNYS